MILLPDCSNISKAFSSNIFLVPFLEDVLFDTKLCVLLEPEILFTFFFSLIFGTLFSFVSFFIKLSKGFSFSALLSSKAELKIFT